MRKNQEIQNELDELSPSIAKIPFNQVYEAPEGYFDELPISLLKNVEVDSTNDLPEDYFEELPKQILSKIKNDTPIVSIQKKYFYIKLTAAAVVAGILGIGLLYFLNQKKTDTPPAYVTNIDSTERYASLNSNNLEDKIYDLNEDDLINYLEDNGHDVNAALVAVLVNENTDDDTRNNSIDKK